MEQPFTAAPHHDILLLLLQLTVLLAGARLGGELARRSGQPAVVGEILAGVVLGPSLLGSLLPGVEVWLVPQHEVQGYLLELIALIGALFMLLITGLEIDVGLIRRHARTAVGAAAGGLLVPSALGFLLALVVPADLLVDPQQRVLFAFFLATTMAISAIAVIAKVLIDLQVLRRNLGQIILAAAMIDDMTAWVMLSIVVGIAAGGALTIWGVGQTLLTVGAFVLLSLTAGRWLVQRILTLVQQTSSSQDLILSVVVVLMFAWSTISQLLHLEAVIGAFVMGMLLGQIPSLSRDVVHKLESVALGIFAPIFFAVAGLKVNVIDLLEPRLLLFTLLFLLVACLGKVAGAYAGARLVGRSDHWTALSCGMALNARGAVQIIIATIGLSLGLFTQEIFSIVVLVALATSVVAPMALRWTMQSVPVDEQEEQRLRKEEQLRDNPVALAHRVLVPLRLRDDDASAVQTVEARVLERLAGTRKLAVTLLSVVSPDDRQRAGSFLSQVSPLFRQQQVTRKVVTGGRPDTAILEEAARSYDLLVMGAPDRGGGSDVLFAPLIDYLVRFAPCPTIVVQGQTIAPDWTPRRILVPTNGSLASRRAAQLAYALAAGTDTCVVVLNVVVPDQWAYRLDSENQVQRQQRIAEEMVEDLRLLGVTLGAQVGTSVQVATTPETAILETAASMEIDLIILGTNVRAGSERLYLGARVERLLHQAPCPIMVINAPYMSAGVLQSQAARAVPARANTASVSGGEA